MELTERQMTILRDLLITARESARCDDDTKLEGELYDLEDKLNNEVIVV